MSTARRAGCRCLGPEECRGDWVGRGATLAAYRQWYGVCGTACGRGEGAMGRLEGKVALISGGARGQGATEARLFAQEGARVVLGDILDAAGQQVEEEIRVQGGEATYVYLDVTREADWVEAVGTAVNRYGKLDILVNNAGIVLRKGIEDTTEGDWDRIMAVNAKGVFLGTKHAIPAMRRAGGGSIVNISSISGLVAIGPPAYIAFKRAGRLVTQA